MGKNIYYINLKSKMEIFYEIFFKKVMCMNKFNK